MKSLMRKWFLAALILLCLAPFTFAIKPNRDKGCGQGRERKCQQVPEGGSALVYVLGTGIACLGAVISRSRVATLNNT
jgi:hypothetical protein